MASLRFKSMVGLMVAGSMFISSTGAVAATPTAISAQHIDPWAALTVLSSGAPAAALCSGVATVGQAPAAGCVLPAVDAPPPVAAGPPPPTPVPPVEAAGGGGLGISPLWLALGAIAIGVGAYFLLRNHHKHSPD